MLLLITGSRDGTSDVICKRLGKEVFRLNYDIFNDYKLEFSPDFWRISNPAGHKIDSTLVTSCFWWKAFNFAIEGQDNYVVEEIKYIFRELYAWCKLRSLTKGNPYDFHNQIGKINLLNIASKYFLTPKTSVSLQSAGVEVLNGYSVVAKSLSSALTDLKGSLLTSEVDIQRIDPNFPWFLQEKISSNFDLTVFVCGERLFSFQRSRENLKGIDWRGEQSFDPNIKEWEQRALSRNQIHSIQSFCKHLNTDWGRLDFMDVDGELLFLEFNANGQWLFLDFNYENRILDQVISYLLPIKFLQVS